MAKKIPDSDLRILSNVIHTLNEALAGIAFDPKASDWDALKSNEARQFLASFFKEVSSSLTKEDTQAAKKLAAVYEAVAEFVVENETVSLYSKGSSD